MESLYNKILSKIKEYDSIIIGRHKFPDLDALGSQFGLKYLIETSFPSKTVYAIGEEFPKKYQHLGIIENPSKEIYRHSLFISVDTPSLSMLDSSYHELSAYKIKIDHHQTRESFFDIQLVNTSFESNCSIIVDFGKSTNLKFNEKIATTLYNGIVSDSGRFLHNTTTKETFERASYLISYGIDLDQLYRKQYETTLEQKRLESYVLSNFKVENNVAYIIYEEDIGKKYNTSISYLKSGTVNMMSNIKGIMAWMTFTKTQGRVMVELRGYVDVLSICEKYYGGGHLRACGCTIEENLIHNFINDVKELVNVK